MCPTGTRKPQSPSSEFRPAFDVLDADHDGKISRDDLRTFYAGIPDKKAADEEMIGTMMSVADSNKDGFVEYDEFERVVSNRSQRSSGGLMEDVFKVMDRDGDGKVSHEDLKTYLNMAGFSASQQDIQAMILLGGGDQTHGVTYQELLRILAVDF